MINGIGYQSMQTNYSNLKTQEKYKKASNNVSANQTISNKATSAEDKLSSKAKAYLEKLRKQFNDKDFFVLDDINSDSATDALNKSTKEYSVLFSPDEIEKMAADEKYAEEKLSQIDTAVNMAEKIKQEFDAQSNPEKTGTYMSKIAFSFNDDGTTTLFASLEQLSKSQIERIEAAKEKAANSETDDVAAEIKDALNEKYALKRTVISASSVEELLKLIKELDWNKILNSPDVGTNIDYTV